MKIMKSLIVLMLAMCMMLSLCACNGDGGNSAETTNNETTVDTTNNEETTEADNNKVTYKVTVVDENNDPVVGAMVQLCLESCIPGLTNNNGVATFNVVEENYKVSFVTMPDGYTCDEDAFYFEDGSYDMTITLKTAA